jgi:hypothetical protein
MHHAVGVVGVLQIGDGVLAYLGANSALHQISGAVSFGMGVMCVGIALIITELFAIRKSGAPGRDIRQAGEAKSIARSPAKMLPQATAPKPELRFGSAVKGGRTGFAEV